MSELLERAKAEAGKYGKIIGMVSRSSPSSVSSESGVVPLEVPFSNYVKERIRIGTFLAVYALVSNSLVLGRVVSLEREDVLSMAKVPAVEPPEDPSTVETPLRVKLELISEMRDDVVTSPLSPVDPQSPVLIPDPGLVSKMLSLPSQGIVLGNLYSGEETSIQVRFPEHLLDRHVVVVGTTGSGKTTFLRHLLTELKGRAFILDLQGDYVGVKKDKAVLLPVTQALSSYLQKNDLTETEFVRARYLQECKAGELITCQDFAVRVVPFSLSLKQEIGELHRIFPFFSEQASLFWPVLGPKLSGSTLKGYGPDAGLWKSINSLAHNYNLAPQTTNNIHRVLLLLSESGMFDEERGEPPWKEVFMEDTVVVDLRSALEFSQTPIAYSSVAYLVIHRVFQQHNLAYGVEDLGRTTIFVDEAHEYFPSSGVTDREALESLINRVMRLGRVRRLGFVMATHKPEDLNDLVLTLANTRVVFRTSQEVLERMGLKKYSSVMKMAPPGLALVSSYDLNEVFLKVPGP